jgi:hypothetical protein
MCIFAHLPSPRLTPFLAVGRWMGWATCPSEFLPANLSLSYLVHTDRYRDRQTQTDADADTQAYRRTDLHTHTGRHTHTHTATHTHTHTHTHHLYTRFWRQSTRGVKSVRWRRPWSWCSRAGSGPQPFSLCGSAILNLNHPLDHHPAQSSILSHHVPQPFSSCPAAAYPPNRSLPFIFPSSPSDSPL